MRVGLLALLSSAIHTLEALSLKLRLSCLGVTPPPRGATYQLDPLNSCQMLITVAATPLQHKLFCLSSTFLSLIASFARRIRSMSYAIAADAAAHVLSRSVRNQRKFITRMRVLLNYYYVTCLWRDVCLAICNLPKPFPLFLFLVLLLQISRCKILVLPSDSDSANETRSHLPRPDRDPMLPLPLMLLLRIRLFKPNNRCCYCYCCSKRLRVVVDRCLQFQIKRGSGTLESRDPNNKTNKQTNLG